MPQTTPLTVAAIQQAVDHDYQTNLQRTCDKIRQAADVFEREKAALEDKDRLMEEKFKEALKRAEETPDEEIKRPFDLD